MMHLAVCLLRPTGRVAFVISAKSEREAVRLAETFANREGYVGSESFAESVKRAGMMERNERGAWGPLSEDTPAGHRWQTKGGAQ